MAELDYFHDMEDVKRAARRRGSHFFAPDTLRFFDSRIGRRVYGGRYFVTSEQFHMVHVPDDGRGYSAPRRWTVREVRANSQTFNIATVGEFQQYATREEANRAAVELAAGREE